MSKKLLRKKLALMLATLKKKRPYYCEVEWIKSTTNCAINTGIYPDLATIKVECRAIKFTGVSLFGEIDPNARFNFTGSGANCYSYYGSSSSQIGAYTPVDASLPYTFVLDRGTFYLDGELKGNTLPTTTGTAPYPIALFCRYNNANLTPNDSGVHTMYYCKIWNGGRLVRDFIPVLDWNYVPCFYDKVSGQLFYNAGTGTFTYGREIHYVDYLESTGTQYIDTGFIPSGNTGVDVKFLVTGRGSGGSDSNIVLVGGDSAGYRCGFGYRNSGDTLQVAGICATGVTWENYALTTGVAHTVLYNYDNQKKCYLDGTLIREDIPYGTATVNYSLYIFSSNMNGSSWRTGVFKLYYCKIVDDGVLVRNYTPAIDENGVGFMFDRVTHTIYDNAGTGVFKYPARETEYIEVTDLGTNNQNPCIDLELKYKPSMSIESKYTRTAMGVSGSVLPLSNSTTMPLIYMPALNANSKTDRFVWRRSGLPESSYYYDFADYPMTVEFKVDAENDALTVNDNVVKTGMIASMNGYTDPYESNSNLYMLSINGTYGGMGKVYYLKLYDTTQVYRDLIPVWKDGVACMYDKQNNVYYSNFKTGTVTAGKIIESEWE